MISDRDLKWLRRKLTAFGPFAFQRQRRIFYKLLREREDLKAQIDKMSPDYHKAEFARLIARLEDRK